MPSQHAVYPQIPLQETNQGIPQALLINRVKLEGFIVSERMDRWPEALVQLGTWIAEGKLKYRETVSEGLRSAPTAFLGMLRGENLGKQLVKVA